MRCQQPIRTATVFISCLFCAACAGDSGGPHLPSGNAVVAAGLQAPSNVPTAVEWPAALPQDALQPWEQADTPHQSSAINTNSEFVPGVERFNEAGEVSDLGEASRLESGDAGSGELSYALYRLALGGGQPGTLSADVNLGLRSDGTPSEYWLGLSRYDQGVWEWHGPCRDAQVRVSTGNAVTAGADYLSPLGNLFISVVASDGSTFDVVGVGASPYAGTDGEPPPTPTAPMLTPVAGGLLLEWLPVAAGDLAGYRIHYRHEWFLDQQAVGLHQLNYLEGGTRHLLANIAGVTYVRISAVDLSGNESALSEITLATPLPGEPPVLDLTLSAPSSGLDDPIMMTASGASTYDWDLDGDGVYDVTGDSTGSAAVDTSRTGIIRPAVRGSSVGGTAVALGAVSLIVSGNARPVANGYANPSYGFAPLTVDFTGAGSDPDGEIVLYSWDFDGNGTYDWSDPANSNPPDQVYGIPYLRNVKFRVDDDQGAYDVDTVTVQVVGNQPPHAQLRAERTAGDAPFTAQFDASASDDDDGTIVDYEWDWDSDGVYDADTGAAATASHTYDEAFEYTATVRVIDDRGATDSASQHVIARGVLLRTPDDSAVTGYYTSIAIVNGNPAIAYHDFQDAELHYVRANDQFGRSWNEPLTVDTDGDVGWYASLAVVDGRPAISYHVKTPNFDLRYVRANDVNGTSWGTPVSPDSNNSVGSHTSLAVINGNPAISYYSETDLELRYVRASNASGSAWTTPVTVDDSSDCGWYTSLKVVAGNPAISYFASGPDFDLRYVRASDADGTAWNAYVTPDTAGDVGRYSSLQVVDGRPAISYFDSAAAALKYVRAFDDFGSLWDLPIVVDSTYLAGEFSSLAIVNGHPAIGYQIAYSNRPGYVRATDTAGGSWFPPITFDSSANAGSDTSLAEASGFAAMSYHDSSNGYLRYALIIE